MARKSDYIDRLPLRDRVETLMLRFDVMMAAKPAVRHNPYFLGIALGRVDEICAAIERGESIEDAIRRGCNDRFAAYMIKHLSATIERSPL